MANNEKWKAIVARKQAEREARIPAEWRIKSLPPASQTNVLDVPRTCGVLSAAELQITETTDATALLEQLKTGRVKSLDVVTAFCKRAAIAQQLTNCLTEIFFDDAIKRAKELDSHFQRTGRPIGPLHGLPISIKDTLCVRGYDATVGFSKLCFQPSKANSALVEVLLQAGAVLYCKTNIPLSLMSLDSHNNVFGRTLNPANRRLTAGGSSGGEGALLAMRGSILGIGTDVGGSIRVPAMCNGLYGVKPSHNRVPSTGMEGGGIAGNEYLSIRFSAGPMAHSMRDCELLLRVIDETKPWERDIEVVPHAWRPVTRRQGPLRVGVMRTDGVSTPLPPVERFISETVTKLGGSSAVEVVELNISQLFGKCGSLVNKFFTTDGYNTVFDNLEETGEPLSPWLQSRLRRKPKASVERIRDLYAERARLQTEFLKVWTAKGGYWASSSSSPDDRLDVIIAPVAPHPTPEIDRWNTAAYTSAFVLLDYPAGTLPVRKVTEADLVGEIDTTKKPLSGWDEVNRTLWTDVDRKVYLGTAQCLQVVSPRWHDQELVEAMTVLDSVLKGTGAAKSRAASKL